nr:TlyA family RNA methyltransferase [Janibacter cremeus]
MDVVLVERGLARSRTRANSLIVAGDVLVDGVTVTKASERIASACEVSVSAGADRWVGRAALKLVGAFEGFGLDVVGRRCLDVGASTGGFTQVLLEHGAAHVTALDVGHGQLVPELEADPRVDDRSGTTIRGLTAADLGGPVEVVVGDLSFISLRLVLAEVAGLVTDDGEAVLLIKPQFEVGRDRVGRGGIVASSAARADAIEAVLARAAEVELSVLGLTASPVRGGGGNHEYLVHLTRRTDVGLTWQAQLVRISELVQEEDT